MTGIFSPQWREPRQNLKQLILRDCLYKNEWVDFYHYRLVCFHTLGPHNTTQGVQTPYKSDLCIIGPL